MARAAQIYEFNLAANQSVELLVEGGFYKLLAASGNVKVSREGGSSIGPLLPGQGERLNFKRLTIQDISGAANTIDILVADESFVDTRIYGNVQVIDGGRLITMNGDAFGGWAQLGGTAGNYTHLQLWNPAGRTKNIALSKIIIGSGTGSPVLQLRWYATPLATLWANPNSKKLGAANSTAELRNETPATIYGNGANLKVWGIANTPYPFEFKEPLIIQPGMGLVVVNDTVNSHAYACFDFYEFIP